MNKMQFAFWYVNVTTVLLVMQSSLLLAQDTYRLSTPLTSGSTYWAFVRLSRPSTPVSWEATDIANDATQQLVVDMFQDGSEERSEQLFYLRNLPDTGNKTAYLQARLPKPNSTRREQAKVVSVAISPGGVFKEESIAKAELRQRVAVVVPGDFRPVTQIKDESRVQLAYALERAYCAKLLIRTIRNGKFEVVWENAWSPHVETSYSEPWSPLKGERTLQPGKYQFVVLLSVQTNCSSLNDEKSKAADTYISSEFTIQEPKD